MIKHSDLSGFYMWFNNETKQAYFLTPHYMIGDLAEFNNTYFLNAKIEFERNNKSIADYELKDKEIIQTPYLLQAPYCEKIGTMLMYFLNTDFSNFVSAYNDFYYIYGMDLIYKYANLDILQDSYPTEKELYSALENLHSNISSSLIEMQTNFKEAIECIYNLNNLQDEENHNFQTYFIADIIKDKSNLFQYINDIEIINYSYIDKKEAYKNDTFENILKELVSDTSILKVSNIYTSKYLGSICFVILQELVTNGFLIKKCQHCNKYYVPSKSNEIYCDFINDTGKSCKDSAALNTYKENLNNNKGLLEYRRIYNRKSNEVSRNKKDKSLKKSFDLWKKEAQNKVKEYKNDVISEDELFNWMIENVAKEEK